MDKIQKATSIFDTINKENANSIAIEMKELVENHDISLIFLNSIFSLTKDKFEKTDTWEFWEHLLPIFNQNTNNQFKNDLLTDSIQKFNLLKQEKAEISNFQIIGCWFSCLLNIHFINSVIYLQIFHDIIKLDHLKEFDIISVVYLSLLISGKTLDDQKNPLTNCWFLFTFIKRQVNECPKFLKFKIIDLLDLRNFGWDQNLCNSYFGGSFQPKILSKEEEIRKRKEREEEEKRQKEIKQRNEEEIKKRKEDKMKRKDEEEIKQRKEEEIKQRKEEEIKPKNEEIKQRKEEEIKPKNEEEIKQGKEEEIKPKNEEEMKRKDEEEIKQRKEEEIKPKNEEIKQRKEEEIKPKNEEEMKRKDEEEIGCPA